MSSYGLILVGYNCAEYFDECINPWLETKKEFDIKICAVNCPFEGFPVDEDDGSREKLIDLAASGVIDKLIISETPVKETEARTAALKWLIEQGCEILIQWDFDEITDANQIRQLINYLEKDKFTTWYRIQYRNYVFTKEQYLAEPFAPPRIFRVESGSYEAYDFYDDNNIMYKGTITRDFKRDVFLPNKEIPNSIFAPKHLTWLNCERSHRKVKYQEARGWRCSFIWDEKENTLKFNPIFPEPKVIRES